MADIEFKDWKEFSLQFGDIVGERRLDVAQSVLKHAEKIVYSDDKHIIGVYIGASCKKEAFKKLGQLAEAGWSTSTQNGPRNGVVVALTIAPTPEVDDDEVVDIIPTTITEEDTVMTTPNNAAPAATAPQYVTIEQMAAAMNAAFAANAVKITTDAAEAATKAAIAAAAAAAETAATAAVTKLRVDMVAKATEITTQAATAAETAAKTELEKFGTQLKAAEAANKALSVKLDGLQDEAKKISKKAKKAKSESGFLDEYSTGEKIAGAVALGVVGYIIYDKFIKE